MASADSQPISEAERRALLTIARGAVVTSGGFSLQRILLTGVEIILARGLGPVAYGVYALAWRIAQLLARLVTFGSVPALQRFVPAYNAEPRRRSLVVGLGYVTTLGIGGAIAVGLWLLAPWVNAGSINQPSFPATMRLFGVLVVLLGVIRISAGVFRAVHSARGEVLLNKLLRPGARLIAAVSALGLGLSVVGVAGSIVLATGLLALLSVPLAARVTGIRPTFRGISTEARRFYNHATPIALSSIGKVFQNRVDVLLVGALISAVAAGVYNVILVLVAITWIPLLSFNQLLPPVASDFYSSDRMERLNLVYSTVTRLIVSAVVPLLAVLAVFGPELLGLFGPSYVDGYLPLLVYLGGVFVGSAVGATGWLLMMTDHQYARMILDWLLAVLNVALTYVFILEFGLVGAALGTSLAIAVQNGIQVVLLRRFEGLWPFDRAFLVPLAAGGCMLGTMWLVRTGVTGTGAVPLGILAGLVVYLGALQVIGPDPRDQLVVRTLAGEYRRTLADWFGQ